MKDLENRVALVTGAASGIGLGIAEALGAAGMRLVLTDLREGRVNDVAEQIARSGVSCIARALDVRDRGAFHALAEEIESSFGPVQVLCNNAGIGLLGSLKDATYADWDWVLGVNLGGVVAGIQTFLPRMLARGLPGHIMATASAGGLFGGLNTGIYTTSKMAVVGLMECLRGDLLDTPIGVSVLCPHLVSTRIHEFEQYRTRGAEPAPVPSAVDPALRAAVSRGMDPRRVGERLVQAIRQNELYVLTHPEIEGILRERFEALMAALPDEAVDPARLEAERSTLHYRVYTESGGVKTPRRE